MSNYKIRVNSEAESKEAQELFLKYGATGNMCLDQSIRYVCTFNGALTQYDFLPSIEFKRITLPELRDLVVLKRNDAWDANYTYCGKPVLKLETQDYKVWNKLDKCWVEHIGSQTDLRAGLKPIEKPMKEYLRKNSNGTYSYIGMVQPENISQNVIEIPGGSEAFNYYDRKDNLFFLKGTGENALFSNDLNDWEWKEWGDIDFDGVVCLWSRHTLPEELPFIDDEPSLGNSKIGRRAITVKVPVESLNDQYAEIEKVRQSAWQKQEGGSHYKTLKIQPMQYALENKLDYAQANVVKYVTRHKEKNGKEDLLKAIHNIELMIEFYYGDEK